MHWLNPVWPIAGHHQHNLVSALAGAFSDLEPYFGHRPSCARLGLRWMNHAIEDSSLLANLEMLLGTLVPDAAYFGPVGGEWSGTTFRYWRFVAG